MVAVKELAEGDTLKEMDKAARGLDAFLKKEGIQEIRIAYGTMVREIKEVSRS